MGREGFGQAVVGLGEEGYGGEVEEVEAPGGEEEGDGEVDGGGMDGFSGIMHRLVSPSVSVWLAGASGFLSNIVLSLCTYLSLLLEEGEWAGVVQYVRVQRGHDALVLVSASDDSIVEVVNFSRDNDNLRKCGACEAVFN